MKDTNLEPKNSPDEKKQGVDRPFLKNISNIIGVVVLIGLVVSLTIFSETVYSWLPNGWKDVHYPTISLFISYMLVFAVRLIQVTSKAQTTINPDLSEYGYIRITKNIKDIMSEVNKKEIFYGARQMVLTASGFILALIENRSHQVGVILPLYTFLVLITVWLEMHLIFTANWKLFYNLIICFFVMYVSLSQYEKMLDEKDEVLHRYTVTIPYQDYSMQLYLGPNSAELRNTYLLCSYDVIAKSPQIAKDSAKVLFFDSPIVKPFKSKEPIDPQQWKDDIVPDMSKIIVEEKELIVNTVKMNTEKKKKQ